MLFSYLPKRCIHKCLQNIFAKLRGNLFLLTKAILATKGQKIVRIAMFYCQYIIHCKCQRENRKIMCTIVHIVGGLCTTPLDFYISFIFEKAFILQGHKP